MSVLTPGEANIMNAALNELKDVINEATARPDLMAPAFVPTGALDAAIAGFKSVSFTKEQLDSVKARIEAAATKGSGSKATQRVTAFLAKLVEFIPIALGNPVG